MPKDNAALKKPEADLDEIRGLIPHLPDLSMDVRTRAMEWASGKLSPDQMAVIADIAYAQQRFPIKLDHPRVVVVTGDHSSHLIRDFTDGRSIIPHLCAQCDADLRLYEMPGGAMDEAECARAIAYGMMMVEVGVDIIFAWIEHAPAVNSCADPLLYLCHHGTRAQAALLGVILASRMGKVPVILLGDGAIRTAQIWQNAYPALKQNTMALGGELVHFAPILQQCQAIADWQKDSLFPGRHQAAMDPGMAE